MINTFIGCTRPRKHPRDQRQPGGGAEEGRRPGHECLGDQWQLREPVQSMKTDIFLADNSTAKYVQSLVIHYVNCFENKSLFNVHKSIATKDLLHETYGEKQNETYPFREKDSEDLKSIIRSKTERAKTKRHKKTKKTNTKRPRRQRVVSGSGNFNYSFTINTSKQLQLHLHRRLKKPRGDEKIKLKNANYVDQNHRHRNPKPKSREDHRCPVEAYCKKLPGTTHFRHPSSNSRACVCPATMARGCSVAGRESVTPLVTTTCSSTQLRIGRRPRLRPEYWRKTCLEIISVI